MNLDQLVTSYLFIKKKIMRLKRSNKGTDWDAFMEACERTSEAEKLQEDYWKPSSIVERMVSEILTKGKTELGEVELYIGAILTYLDEQYEEQKKER